MFVDEVIIKLKLEMVVMVVLLLEEKNTFQMEDHLVVMVAGVLTLYLRQI